MKHSFLSRSFPFSVIAFPHRKTLCAFALKDYIANFAPNYIAFGKA